MRRHPVTWSLVAICVAVYIAEVAFPGSSGGPPGQGPVVALGAVYAPLVLRGELWRLVTAGFIHFDITHILFNMVGLVYGGRWCEERFGGGRTLAVFMAAVIAGDLAALVTTLESRTVTAGASGGIMGLFAAMGVLGWRFPVERESLASAAGPILATLLNGFLHPGVSNAGHVGGLVGGAASALVLGPSPAWLRRAQEAQARILESTLAAEPARPRPPIAADVLADPANTRVFERTPRSMLPLVGGVVFFGVVAWIGATGGQWAICAMGGGLVALALFGLVNHARLVLTPRGFEVTQRLRRSSPVRWSDVEGFGLLNSPRGVAAPQTLSYMLTPAAMRRLAQDSGQVHAPAPRTIAAVFGMTALEQGRMMEDWRTRWGLNEPPG